MSNHFTIFQYTCSIFIGWVLWFPTSSQNFIRDWCPHCFVHVIAFNVGCNFQVLCYKWRRQVFFQISRHALDLSVRQNGVTSEFGATREPFSSCYICYQLLPVTTSHYQSLPVATSCYQCYQLLPVLPVATSRYQSLPVATSRYQLLSVATSRYQSLPVAISCYQCFLLVAATGRYQSLQVDTS